MSERSKRVVRRWVYCVKRVLLIAWFSELSTGVVREELRRFDYVSLSV